MVFSQVTSWFIILTAAGSLHTAGITNITSGPGGGGTGAAGPHLPPCGRHRQGYLCGGDRRPGVLAVPVFAASASYALAETYGWREGLSLTFKQAPQFYVVIVLATLVGLAFNLVGINPIKALVFAAVINGVAAVPLILLILLIGNNRRIMGPYVNGRLVNVVGWATFAAMGAAAVTLCLTWRP
jgi:hypothetical protein